MNLGDYQLIVFDWDGTLRDSIPTILACADSALAEHGLEADPEDVKKTVGLGLLQSVPQWSTGVDESNLSSIIERYSHHWRHGGHVLRLFPGAAELVERAATDGVDVTVATGKSRIGLDHDLEVSGLGSWIKSSRTPDECRPKPHGHMVTSLMEELRVSPEGTVVVGDTTHDLLMARDAGVDAVGVLTGAMQLEQLDEVATACVSSVGELLALYSPSGR